MYDTRYVKERNSLDTVTTFRGTAIPSTEQLQHILVLYNIQAVTS